VSTTEMSGFALATRARDASTRAHAAVWELQVRSWPQPSSGHDGAIAALHQAGIQLRSAADALDPPNLSTYTPAMYVRSGMVSTAATLVGVIVSALTLSGPAMAVVMAVCASLMATLNTVYVRWRVRVGLRGIDGEEPDLAVTAAELTTEVAALLDRLRPEHSPHRARAHAPLQTAAEWTELAIQETAPTSTTEGHDPEQQSRSG
jgi:hypothetical protein